MHEYIKKLSVSLCLLEKHIKDIEYKIEIKELVMSLININNVNRSVSKGDIEQSLFELRRILMTIIDFLDLLKIVGKVSLMNAEIILNATIKIIGELDKQILHEQSFILPKFSLAEMSQDILRDKVKDNLQTEYLKNINGVHVEDIFNFTKLPHTQTKPETLEEKEDVGVGSEKNENLKTDEVKGDTNFDWGNEQVNDLNSKLKTEINQEKREPIVYTIFGDAEQNLINERRAQIISILKNGGGSIATIAKLIPGLNTKTLQRDLIELMRERKVIMLGKKRWAKYYLK